VLAQSMIEALGPLVREVGAADSLDAALALIVERVKAIIDADACLVYLARNGATELELMASDGGPPEVTADRLRFSSRDGLVGWVATHEEPLNVADSPTHPAASRSDPSDVEVRYHAFLGVPVMHYRRMLGVLVARRHSRRAFSTRATAFLVTVSAQVAGALSGVAIADAVRHRGTTPAPPFLQGVTGASGVAIGTAVAATPVAELSQIQDRPPRDLEVEEQAFRTAVGEVADELARGKERMADRLSEEANALFDVYALLVRGDQLVEHTVHRIRAGHCAAVALRDTVLEFAGALEQAEDAYLRARAEDLRAVGARLLRRLRASRPAAERYPERCVLVGDEVSLARIAEVPAGRLIGIVCLRGSALSHTVMLARALGIPAVMGLGDLNPAHFDGRRVVVDGYRGRVFVDPTAPVLAEWRRVAAQDAALSAELRGLRDLPAVTPDGFRVTLEANAGLLSDLPLAHQHGAEGVGLYRTEFPFMLRDSFPTEHQQQRLYAEVLASFAPRGVTLRTLDVGGDKPLAYFPIDDRNAFLGWRGIRVTLDHPEIFMPQLRAMLRAHAVHGNLRILLPMVSRCEELDESLALLRRARDELRDEGCATELPPVGVNIEVPAAVYQIRDLAERVDFISIGSNDLAQYLLAVDRNNAHVAGLFKTLHPAVLRAIHDTVAGARAVGRPVSVCGEMAGDPVAVVFLLGMRIETLSMAASSIPRVKWVLRSIPRRRAAELLDRALGLRYADDVRRLGDSVLEEAGLGELVHR